MAEIFKDSKTFVDMSLRYNTSETLAMFQKFMDENGPDPTKQQTKVFVDSTFVANDELVYSEPEDWKENPKFLERIRDGNFRQWAFELNALWKNLSRRISDDVKVNPHRHSILYVPNAFIIPGGRFREFYYWDTYWIANGLLLSEMNRTVKGIIGNMLHLVDEYGFVPNGGRKYYLERSQPPMLIPMMGKYLAATSDTTFLRESFKLLEKEYYFWINNRTVDVEKNGKTYRMARYHVFSSGPRPESYREDFMTTQHLKNEVDKTTLYMNLKSGAEAGWDFSSRWFINNGTDEGTIKNLDVMNIIPVDLNAFLYKNALLLSEFSWILGNVEQSLLYMHEAKLWQEAVTDVLWNDDAGVWLDYDLKNNISRNYFYPSNVAPLWTKCYSQEDKVAVSKKVLAYLAAQNITQYAGGVPASLALTGEQWDFPNAWPPLQMLIIQGLAATEVKESQQLAEQLARNWIRANYKGYSQSGDMFEKYDSLIPGRYGSGGEYIVQSGFGWTNGAVLELLNMYGPTVLSSDKPTQRIRPSQSSNTRLKGSSVTT
ncbi:trehalase-like isoform X2 [Bacillus rossius redtenbacheri]